MTPEQFVYWFQGFLEIGTPETITSEQVTVIKEHMAKVLTHRQPMFIPAITPVPNTNPFPTPHIYC